MSNTTEKLLEQIRDQQSNNPSVANLQVEGSPYDTAGGAKTFNTLKLSTQAVGIQVITTTLNAADSTVTVQGSADGTNWANLVDSTAATAQVVLDVTTGSNFLYLTQVLVPYIRFVFDPVSVTTGTIDIKATQKF